MRARTSSSLFPVWPFATAKPLMSGTVSVSQTMTLLMSTLDRLAAKNL
jgi:hypothetical protein